jgi:hypothetical protein
MRENKLSKKVINRYGPFTGYIESYYTKQYRLLFESEYDNYKKDKIRILNHLHLQIDLSDYSMITLQKLYSNNYEKHSYNEIKYYTLNELIFEENVDINEWYYNYINWYNDDMYNYQACTNYCVIGKPQTYFYKNLIMLYTRKVSSLGMCNIVYYYYDDNDKEIKYYKCNNKAIVNISTNINDMKIDIKNNNHYLNDYYNNDYQFTCRTCSRCKNSISNCININRIIMEPYKIKSSIILTYIKNIFRLFIDDYNTSDLLSLEILKYLYE